MKETNSKIAASVEGYNAPKARVITVKVEGIICESDPAIEAMEVNSNPFTWEDDD